eukprot:4407177-Prymnesium_polylepis.1
MRSTNCHSCIPLDGKRQRRTRDSGYDTIAFMSDAPWTDAALRGAATRLCGITNDESEICAPRTLAPFESHNR